MSHTSNPFITRRSKMKNVSGNEDRQDADTHAESRMWVEKCLMTLKEVHAGLAAARGRNQESTFHAVHFINE